MLGAIGSTTTYSPAGKVTSVADLEAQLARYQKALSDCVGCSSAKTPEGQNAINEISCKICDIKARIEKIMIERSSMAAPNIRTSAVIPSNSNVLASNSQSNTVVATAPASGSATATVGSILNVFA